MSTIELHKLLAPTWKERVRAVDALQQLPISESDFQVFPPYVQAEILALRPSPAAFLSALIAFWGYVSERESAKMMGKAAPTDTHRYGNPDLENFPLDRSLTSIPANGMRAMWVFGFVSRLGPSAQLVEAQLAACVGSSDSTVSDAAEKALGSANRIGDGAFDALLASADAQGRNGAARERASAIAKHTTAERLHHVLDGIRVDAPAAANSARFMVLERLNGAVAETARQFLATCLSLKWRAADRLDLVWTYTVLSRSSDVPDDCSNAIRALSSSHESLERCAAALWLGERGAASDDDICLALARDEGEFVRLYLCRGLAHRESIGEELLRVVAAQCLGNYYSGDGEPHDAAIALLLRSSARARAAIPEVLRWWNDVAQQLYPERDEIVSVLDLCGVLEPGEALPFLPGLKRVLARWTADDDTVQLPSLEEPGAVDVIQSHIEKSMVASGADAGQAQSVAAFYGALLGGIAANREQMQAEIDAEQAEYEAEQREIYPEQYETASGLDDETSGDSSEPADEDEGDSILARLRIEIRRLDPNAAQ